MMSATYSPDDNKLRLYASARLDADTYARVKAAGFRWAPKQDLFFAPMWTPDREDLLIDLCGDIEDDDRSLIERAEDRSERFEGYRDNRTRDAERARDAVKAIADGIPFGQPILVGHHSERHARRDAKRIENGMRRAVQMWRTAEYWTDRAAGAIRHAKYKERPDVRARRIKGLDADRRKQAKHIAEAQIRIKMWGKLHAPIDPAAAAGTWAAASHQERAEHIANRYSTGCGMWSELRDRKITPRAAQLAALKANGRIIAYARRWLSHFDLRLAYERAMLADAGGTIADRVGPEKGGAVKCWASPRGGWSYIQRVNKVSVTVLDNWGNGGDTFTRTIAIDKLAGIMSAADVTRARQAGRLIDASPDSRGAVLGFALRPDTDPAPEPPQTPPEPAKTLAQDIDAMRDSLRAGVTVAAVPGLFETPTDLAERVISAADIRPGMDVLEPSAGTGRLIGAMGGRMFGHPDDRTRTGSVTAIELHAGLCQKLRGQFPLTTVIADDFLRVNGSIGPFDRIVMNPPFSGGADIVHVRRAYDYLKPGGRLVALMSEGPFFRSDRQSAEFRDWLDDRGCSEPLPAGSFADSHTNVNARLVIIDRKD